MSIHCILAVLAVGWMSAVISAVAPAQILKPSLFVSVDLNANLDAAVTITNTGPTHLRLYPYGTVLDPAPTHDFVVDGSLADGPAAAPAFVGKFAKVSKNITMLTAKGYLLELAPGSSHTVETCLFSRYNFATSGSGLYALSVRQEFSALTEDSPDAFVRVVADTPRTAFTVFREHFKRTPAPASSSRATKRPKAKSGPYFSGCNIAQQEVIKKAAKNAQAGSQLAARWVNASDSTFKTWFGKPAYAGAATVRTHYSGMNGDFSKIRYHCNSAACGSADYAFVYAQDATALYLCQQFWQAPGCGADSQQGTLVHEASHYKENGGTMDYVYGSAECRSLAVRDPAHAIQNADSHEYYEESVFGACVP